MNDRSVIQAPEPAGRGAWLDNYMPEGNQVGSPRSGGLITTALLRGIAYRQRWIIAGSIAAALVIGLVITLLTPPTFTAEAKVKMAPYGTSILAGQAINIEQSLPGNLVNSYMATQLEVIRSRSLAERIASDLKLEARYDLLGKDIDESRPPNMSDEDWIKAKREKAASILVESLEVNIPAQNWIVLIEFSSENPALAAEMANAYADAFVASGVRSTQSSNDYALNYLSEQIDEVRARLGEAEKAANTYARNTGIMVQQVAGSEEGSDSTTLTSVNLADINNRLSVARGARIEAEQRWRAVQAMPASQLPEVQSSTVLQTLLADRTSKQSQLTELQQRYNDDFPQIITLKAQIGGIDEQIARTSSDIKATVRNAFVVAQNQERALQAELTAISGDRLVEQDKQIEYGALEREAEGLQNELRSLLDRYNQVNSAANVDSGAVTKLDSAIVPRSPSSPNLAKNLALALVFGIALAGGLAVLRETLDDRIKTPDEVEDKIGLPLLGFTPFVDEKDIGDQVGKRFNSLMEAYSSIRAAIDFSLSRKRNVIQFTSTQANEGKSTTAVILAELFANLGRKTLLIDADLRKPSIAGLVEIEAPKVGFVEVVLGHAALEDAVVSGVHKNLDILPVANPIPNPVEIFGSDEMREFIAKYRTEYSLIIFDSAPVLGLADAPMLANIVDGTIFVMEASKLPFSKVRAAVRRIIMAQGSVIGVILTKYRPLSGGDNYSYGYDYYSYGGDKEST